jgi:DNA mismatch repair protein MutL
MIATDSFPMYVLFIDLDPAVVDVKVHPTKQDIKFEDEKIVYAFVQGGIKPALAQFSVTPTLDFDLDASIQQLSSIQQPFTEEKKSAASSSSLFKGFTQKNQAHFIEPGKKSELKHWREFYEDGSQRPETGSQKSEPDSYQIGSEMISGTQTPTHYSLLTTHDVELTQLLNTYIITPSAKGFILIHQQAAHERVLYDQLKAAAHGKPIATQRSMFPSTIELAPADTMILEELMGDLQDLGYMIEPFGKNTFVIQGTPADLEAGNEKNIIDLLIEQYKHFNPDMKFSRREKLIRSLAKQQAIRTGVRLTEREMRNLVQDLFASEQPNTTPDGNPTYLEFKQDQLEKMFGR